MDRQHTEQSDLVIDRELGIKLAGNKPDLANDMLNMLTSSLPTELDSMRHAKTSNDIPDLHKRVHRLHGAVCYCGLPRLKRVLAEIESSLKQDDTSNICKQFEALEFEVAQVMEQLPLLSK